MFDLKIDSNLEEAAQRFGWDAANIEDAANVALHAAAEAVNKRVAQRIQAIYQRPIPTSSTGRALWRRSGDLARGRTLTYPSRGLALISIQGTADRYAERRHELGVSWHPRRPAAGIVRRNPFMAQAQDDTEPKVAEIFERAFSKEMGL